MRRLTNSKGGQERGATAILAALLMTGILGFAGLAIDLGATYAKHTELQNGADAAALALAQQWASDKDDCVEGADLATPWVQRNVNNDAAAADGVAKCLAANKVRVEAAGVQDHWFMPVVGKDSSDIDAHATVEWGSPWLTSSIPLTISSCSFEAQAGLPKTTPPSTITIWLAEPSGPVTPEDAKCAYNSSYPPGGFHGLQNDFCATQVFMPDGYVISSPGGSGWNKKGQDKAGACDLHSLLGQVLLVPIFDGVDESGANAKYFIKQFASFELTGYKIQQGPAGAEGAACFGTPPPYSDGKSCIVGKFIDYISLEDVEGELLPPTSIDNAIIIRFVD